MAPTDRHVPYPVQPSSPECPKSSMLSGHSRGYPEATHVIGRFDKAKTLLDPKSLHVWCLGVRNFRSFLHHMLWIILFSPSCAEDRRGDSVLAPPPRHRCADSHTVLLVRITSDAPSDDVRTKCNEHLEVFGYTLRAPLQMPAVYSVISSGNIDKQTVLFPFRTKVHHPTINGTTAKRSRTNKITDAEPVS